VASASGEVHDVTRDRRRLVLLGEVFGRQLADAVEPGRSADILALNTSFSAGSLAPTQPGSGSGHRARRSHTDAAWPQCAQSRA